MAEQPKLTKGQRANLEHAADLWNRGLRSEGTPMFFCPRGGGHRACIALRDMGYLEQDWCSHEDRSGCDERLGFRLTDEGVSLARSLGIEVTAWRIPAGHGGS